MAQINVKTSVTGPTEINIPLVRADHVSQSNVFRVCFEVGLSLSSTLLGFVLGLPTPTSFHWLTLAIVGVATGIFLIMSLSATRQSKIP